jgi:hypothetical protein
MPTERDPTQVTRRLQNGEQWLPSQRPVNRRKRNSYIGPSRYRSSRYNSPGPTVPGGNRYSGHVGQQTSKDPGGIPVTHAPLIVSDLAACLGGVLPVLMAGDLNAKHVDLNSRLITRGGRLLRDHADKNSCLIHGPNTPTTVPITPLPPLMS